MAVVIHLSNNAAKAMADGLAAYVDGGTAGVIEIYDGTIPADADTAITTQVKLASLPFSATAFGAATDANPGALITAAAITSDSAADATGTAAWARIKQQAGGNTCFDVNVNTSGAFITVNTTSFVIGATVSCSSFTMTQPES